LGRRIAHACRIARLALGGGAARHSVTAARPRLQSHRAQSLSLVRPARRLRRAYTTKASLSMSQRILVCGGTGSFGARLVVQLAATTKLDVVIGARRAERAEALAASLRAD